MNKKIGVTIMLLFCFTLAITELIHGGIGSIFMAGSTRWPIILGVVTWSNLDYSPGSADSTDSYGANVKYDYALGNSTYGGSRVTFGSKWFDTKDEALDVIRHYPVGKAVSVSYDPLHPDISVLEPGIHLYPQYIGMGIFFLVFGLIGLIIVMKKKLLGRSAP